MRRCGRRRAGDAGGDAQQGAGGARARVVRVATQAVRAAGGAGDADGRVCECGHENRAKMAEMFGCRGLSAYLLVLMKKVQPYDLQL